MKKHTRLQDVSIALLIVFTFTSCATVTSNYQSKDSHLVTIEHTKDGKVYRRDGQAFKPRFYNQGLADAVSPNPEAKEYAEKGIKKRKLSRALSFSSIGALLVSLPLFIIGKNRSNNTMTGIGLGIEVGGLALAFGALLPENHSQKLFQNAINKYNDDVLSEMDTKTENSDGIK